MFQAGPDLVRCMSRIYLEESLKAAGEFTDSLEDDLADAQKLLALGPREAEDIRSEIVSKTYKCDAALISLNYILSTR